MDRAPDTLDSVLVASEVEAGIGELFHLELSKLITALLEKRIQSSGFGDEHGATIHR